MSFADYPKRTRGYQGPATNTANWDGFEFRSGDIVLSTPPKSGTTWSQAILMMLIHGQAVRDRPVWRDSFWLDCAFRDRVEMTRKLQAQTHTRCIKTHTPLDGIPYHPDVTYLTVYRHPIDVHFSFKRHVSNMKEDWLDFVFPEPPEAAFDRFLTSPMTDMGTDDLTLASINYHYQSFRKWSHLPNIHFFHFADMKRDVVAQINRFASVAKLACTPALVDQIAEASSFGSMKDTARKEYDPNQSPFKDPSAFFDTGTSHKWQGRLSTDQMAAYDKSVSGQTVPVDRRWLENGTTVQP